MLISIDVVLITRGLLGYFRTMPLQRGQMGCKKDIFLWVQDPFLLRQVLKRSPIGFCAKDLQPTV
jgi:hypothetical protein